MSVVLINGVTSSSRGKAPVYHDDVIKWKHFPRYWPFVRGIHRSAVNSPHKGQWRGALMFSLLRAWINAWVNTREAVDLRRHHTHYDVNVMIKITRLFHSFLAQPQRQTLPAVRAVQADCQWPVNLKSGGNSHWSREHTMHLIKQSQKSDATRLGLCRDYWSLIMMTCLGTRLPPLKTYADTRELQLWQFFVTRRHQRMLERQPPLPPVTANKFASWQHFSVCICNNIREMGVYDIKYW